MSYIASRVAASPDTGMPVLVTIAHAAEILACSDSTIRRLGRKGELSITGRRGLPRVEHDSILAYISRHRRSSADAEGAIHE